mgnify:CR=1 FL=1
MLVGGGMEHDMGTETLVDAFDTMDHANVSHDRGKLDIGEFFFQLQPDVVHRGFGTVEQDQLFQPEMAELATEFATDGTGGSGDQNDFAFQEPAISSMLIRISSRPNRSSMRTSGRARNCILPPWSSSMEGNNSIRIFFFSQKRTRRSLSSFTTL